MKSLLTLLILMLAGTGIVKAGSLQVFVSIPPQKQFVSMIAGDRVDVKVMLSPGESPETFSPGPKLMASLADAVLYFEAGVPFEKVWRKAISSVNHDIEIVECCKSLINALAINSGYKDEALHIWNDPVVVREMAREIMDKLILIDPDNEEYYRENFRIFAGRLDQLDSSIKQALKSRRTDYFIVSHAAWGAFANRYGLKQLALEKNGYEVGPRTLAGIISLAMTEGLNTIFVEEQFRTPFIETLATELQASIVTLDPLADDYLQNMVYVTGQIARSITSQ